jgi:hypothetical protein
VARITRIDVRVAEMQHSASINWCDADEVAHVNVDGLSYTIPAPAAELLYLAMHEIFGKKD